jgi:pimeloyl-ACP methyl ester carboxylesterase
LKPPPGSHGAAPTGASPHDPLMVPRHGSFHRSGDAGPYRLHYCEWGRVDNRRTIVCAHGAEGDARDFDVLARDLSAHYRVVCPDLAARRESDWLRAPMPRDLGQIVTDLDALLSQLGIGEVDWVGTSLGGVLGMHLAARAATPVRRLVIRDVGGASATPRDPQAGSALAMGVRETWSDAGCPTLVLRSTRAPKSAREIDAIRGFLGVAANEPRAANEAVAA